MLIQKYNGRRNAGLLRSLIAACPVSIDGLVYSSGLELPWVEEMEKPHEDPQLIMVHDCQII